MKWEAWCLAVFLVMACGGSLALITKRLWNHDSTNKIIGSVIAGCLNLAALILVVRLGVA